MLINILKKDLKRKKSMNFILFTFIALSALFLASSLSNLKAVSNAVDYFGEQSNVADYFIYASDEWAEELEDWLSGNQHVIDWQKDAGIFLNAENFTSSNYEVGVGVTYLDKLPKRYNLLLQENNNEPLTTLKNGEITMSYHDASRNGLTDGDEITIRVGDRERTFRLAYIVKDFIFGSVYMDTNRLAISDDDYAFLYPSENREMIILYSLKLTDAESFEKELQKADLILGFQIDKSTIEFTFTLELMTAAILIVVSVCLIVIALVVLRFTIIFTIQDYYKEIGIMKAIGLKNAHIKGLYMVKYFTLSAAGAVTGVLLSFPFGSMMLRDYQKAIAMESTKGNRIINILCGLAVILLVVLFCWISAGGIHKFTAIEAIRSGSAGERFKGKSVLNLNRSHGLPVILFMALSSILSGFKNYISLFIIFILGTLLIILPLNALNTLNGEDIITAFGMVKTDIYIDNPGDGKYFENDENYMMDDIRALEAFYLANDVGIILNPYVSISGRVYLDDIADSYWITASKSYVYDADAYQHYLDGTPPVLPNEIAMTELAMDKLGARIGDTVTFKIGDEEKHYIITASFHSMINMGYSLYLSKSAEVDLKNIFAIILQGNFINREDVAGQTEKLKELSPDFTVKNTKERVDLYIGPSIEMIGSIRAILIVVVLFINYLITILLMRTFITKERGEISLIKNIGFTNRAVKRWQILRISLTLIVSVVIGAIISNPINPVMSRYTFGAMGMPKAEITVVPFDVYFLYPLLLLTGTVIAAIIGAESVNRIGFRDINNVE